MVPRLEGCQHSAARKANAGSGIREAAFAKAASISCAGSRVLVSGIVVDSIPIEVSLYQKFNRFFYQLTGAAVRCEAPVPADMRALMKAMREDTAAFNDAQRR